MPVLTNAKRAGLSVRIRRQLDKAPSIEKGWKLVRVEPESGNVVCEREGERIICPRREFELLNFTGSDDVWNIISDPKNDDLIEARKNWTKLDLRGVIFALLRYARKLDPAFGGVQTTTDLVEKISEIEIFCKKSMDLLRLEIKRAQNEYERFTALTATEYDKKDDLLSLWRGLEDQYAAHAYRYESQLPAWHRMCFALKQLEATVKNE